ncbi:hypothetical protein BDZ89DRAFT_673586 [Hymenopellis radicata]|nr:hypothetical protein BDZ89DRAFT_673586 [Hymenopellis radicata]
MMHLPLSLSILLLPLLSWAQSSTSITGSVTGTAIGTGSVTGSATSTTTASGSSSASSTLSADLPSLSGYSTCVTTCLQLSIAAANCTSVAQVNCYCGSLDFTSSLTDCVTADGPDGCPSELPQAETLAGQFCHLASTSTSLSFTITSVSSSGSSSSTPMSHSGSSSTTTASGSSASATTSDNAALGLTPSRTSGGVLFNVAVVLLYAAIDGRMGV